MGIFFFKFCSGCCETKCNRCNLTNLKCVLWNKKIWNKREGSERQVHGGGRVEEMAASDKGWLDDCILTRKSSRLGEHHYLPHVIRNQRHTFLSKSDDLHERRFNVVRISFLSSIIFTFSQMKKIFMTSRNEKIATLASIMCYGAFRSNTSSVYPPTLIGIHVCIGILCYTEQILYVIFVVWY